jgi:hypothetical protein
MTTKNAAPALDQFESPVEATTQLPPLAILEIGDIADLVLNEVSITLDDEQKPRTYYRGVLLAELTCKTKGKDETEYRKVTFGAGEEISLPGSGGLDYTMKRIALKKAGSPLNSKDVSWNIVQGDRFIVERKADDKMGKGRHKGKMVKAFTVQHAAAKAKGKK